MQQPNSQSKFALNLFQGRIGEAYVESVLTEYGYRVVRSGFEKVQAPGVQHTGAQRLTPDFAIYAPGSEFLHYVEVKTTTYRPNEITTLPKGKLDVLRQHYPRTLLAYVSSYDGSVNCQILQSIRDEQISINDDGFCVFDFTKGTWFPLWHFFPLITPNARLLNRHHELLQVLGHFSKSIARSTVVAEMFEGETESLRNFLDEFWETKEPCHDPDEWEPFSDQIERPDPNAELPELREAARNLVAWQGAMEIMLSHPSVTLDIVDDEETYPLDYYFGLMVQYILGKNGESLAWNTNELLESLEPFPDAHNQVRKLLVDQEQGLIVDSHELMRRLSELVPEEVTFARFRNPSSGDESATINVRAMMHFSLGRNRLDSLKFGPHLITNKGRMGWKETRGSDD